MEAHTTYHPNSSPVSVHGLYTPETPPLKSATKKNSKNSACKVSSSLKGKASWSQKARKERKDSKKAYSAACVGEFGEVEVFSEGKLRFKLKSNETENAFARKWGKKEMAPGRTSETTCWQKANDHARVVKKIYPLQGQNFYVQNKMFHHPCHSQDALQRLRRLMAKTTDAFVDTLQGISKVGPRIDALVQEFSEGCLAIEYNTFESDVEGLVQAIYYDNRDSEYMGRVRARAQAMTSAGFLSPPSTCATWIPSDGEGLSKKTALRTGSRASQGGVVTPITDSIGGTDFASIHKDFDSFSTKIPSGETALPRNNFKLDTNLECYVTDKGTRGDDDDLDGFICEYAYFGYDSDDAV